VADDAARFRQRARDCRNMAAETKNEEWRHWLLGLAQDLEDEADREEADEAQPVFCCGSDGDSSV
jgi:hypothetical protein